MLGLKREEKITNQAVFLASILLFSYGGGKFMPIQILMKVG